MRVITGKGSDIRKYILNINMENVLLFPENGLDINEQASFLESIIETNFDGDIITFSSYIISDAKTGTVYNLENKNGDFKLVKNEEHKFGDSADLTFNIVMNRNFSCSNLALKEIKNIKEDIKNGVEKHLILKKLLHIGDSFEKMEAISILRKREKNNIYNNQNDYCI